MNVKLVALGDVVEVKGGGTPSKNKPHFYSGDIPWVTPKDMKVWDIFDSIDKITPEAVASSATSLIPERSVLLVNRSGILKHTLPVGITRKVVAINQDMKALLCSDRVYPEYLAHLIKAAEPTILKWVRATTADNFPIQNLKELEIPLPPLEEQKRIAAILDQADALRRLRRRALDRLNTLGQAIFHEMFGEVVFSNFQPRSRHLSELLTVRSGFAFASQDFANEGFPVIRISNLDGGIVDLDKCIRISELKLGKGEKFEVFAGDILIAMTGAIGKIGIVPSSDSRIFLNQRVGRFAVNHKEPLDPAFVRYLITSDAYRSLSSAGAWGAAQSNVSGAQLVDMFFSPPALKVQQEFATRINETRNLQAVHEAAQRNAERLFSSLQHRAFRGEL